MLPLLQNREINVHGEQERECGCVYAGLWLHSHHGTVQILGTVGRATGGRR